jgi:hypothetical protein
LRLEALGEGGRVAAAAPFSSAFSSALSASCSVLNCSVLSCSSVPSRLRASNVHVHGPRSSFDPRSLAAHYSLRPPVHSNHSNHSTTHHTHPLTHLPTYPPAHLPTPPRLPDSLPLSVLATVLLSHVLELLGVPRLCRHSGIWPHRAIRLSALYKQHQTPVRLISSFPVPLQDSQNLLHHCTLFVFWHQPRPPASGKVSAARLNAISKGAVLNLWCCRLWAIIAACYCRYGQRTTAAVPYSSQRSSSRESVLLAGSLVFTHMLYAYA